MSLPPLPERMAPEELDRLRVLGEEVRDVLTSVGLPAVLHADPYQMPPRVVEAVGAHIGIDPTTPGQVDVHWECGEKVRSAASAAFAAGDFRCPAMVFHVTVLDELGETMVRILRQAGYEAGLGVDMAPDYLWVKRPAA